ncbi:MAG TPA: (deoxy)nucleoside triphosphate pyrophosphohydrolase [Desulfitobacteriaceae bacterium]|jgi:8-oxo-dGTP diphosphatase|nr:(deoxy)nucleoside triphosphate pyrophosphohydrolase [Desulfitobacteriaceae bacterium]
MIEVTASIISRDNKVLIAQRPLDDRLAGKWEFPGGKIEPGETPEECLKREIREEFNVEIEVLEYFDQSIYTSDKGQIKLMAYLCKWISGEFILKVHSRIRWVGYDELDLFDYAPADIPLALKLKSVSDKLTRT